VKRVSKAVMRSYRFDLPNFDLPIRLRPWFLLFTGIVMLLLAFLGFTNFSRSLPLNDKLLHLICLCVATAVFYFIFDVEEDARRIWFWRHSGLILTGVMCFFFGGIVSEIVQSMLPYKEFQMGDVVANLLGSAIGLYIAYNLERYYRHRREISRLYRPISNDLDSQSESEDEDDQGTTLLPLHNSRSQTVTSKINTKPRNVRIGNVWDEREEIFGVGDSDDEDAGVRLTPSPREPIGPKIIITPSP